MKIICIGYANYNEDRLTCYHKEYNALENSYEGKYCIINDKGEKDFFDESLFKIVSHGHEDKSGKYLQCINNDRCEHLSLGGIYKINYVYDDFYVININNKFYHYHKNRFILHEPVKVKCISNCNDKNLIKEKIYEANEINEYSIKIKKENGAFEYFHKKNFEYIDSYKPKIFVISDLHLGHFNIIKLCNRPFNNALEMDKEIINRWNSVVRHQDLVYVVGDFSFKGNNTEYYLDKLNGNIILIKGNHDKFIKHYKIKGIYDYKEIEVEGVKYVLSHYPMISWNGQFRNSIHLYGHVHSSGNDWEFPKVPNAYSVCCEFHNYTPIEINKFKPKEFKTEIMKLK